MSKVTTSQRLSVLKYFISEFEFDLLHYFDLTEEQKKVVKSNVSHLMNFIERVREEVE